MAACGLALALKHDKGRFSASVSRKRTIGVRCNHVEHDAGLPADGPDDFQHGTRFRGHEVITFTGTGTRHVRFAEVAQRVRCLAAALQRLGIRPGDRVGTFCATTRRHLEAYFAVPCLGAVLHTVNIRLFAEQIAYAINHAEDRVLLIDAALIPLLAPSCPC